MPSPPPDLFTPEAVERALSGDRATARALFDALLPHVQRKVNAILVRRASAGGARVVRQEVLDLTQDVFVALFENEGKALRSWDPAMGASLPTWVGRIAEKRIISTLRTAKRNPWTETPTEDDALTRVGGVAQDHHQAVASRQRLGRVIEILKEKLSEQGYALFCALFLEEKSVDVVASSFEMTPNAVYIWRNRLKKSAREALESLKDSSGPHRMV